MVETMAKRRPNRKGGDRDPLSAAHPAIATFPLVSRLYQAIEKAYELPGRGRGRRRSGAARARTGLVNRSTRWPLTTGRLQDVPCSSGTPDRSVNEKGRTGTISQISRQAREVGWNRLTEP